MRLVATVELDEPASDFKLAPDKRPRTPEPPPVRLVAVADMSLPAVAGLEADLDRFYIGLLLFQRDPDAGQIVYWAENFSLRFMVEERPAPRPDLRPVGIAVASLAQVSAKLDEAELPYLRQRGIGAADDNLLLRDPCGNWLQIIELTLFG